MGNSPSRHDSSAGSFRENSKQYRDYRALENKIRLLKIQANNYNGIGKDAIYTDTFASVQDTIETVRYLREKCRSSNQKIEYDMLDGELKSCLQILSARIHQTDGSSAGGRPKEQQQPPGAAEQLHYALDGLEGRVQQLRSNFAQLSGGHFNLSAFSQLESTAKGLYKELDNLLAPNNAKKLHLRELLTDTLNDVAAKKAELNRTSKYDNLDGSSEPMDPSLQLLLKMEKSLSAFRDREYLTADGRDVPKMIETLTCYKNDLHNLRVTSKDVNKKHVDLLGFVDGTMRFLEESRGTGRQRGAADTADRREDPLMKSIQDELSKIQTSATQNSAKEAHLKRIVDLLQQVNYSLQLKDQHPYHKSAEVISNRIDDQHRPGSTDDVRKVTAKSALQTALERKGYRKTFLANTMIKQHAAKMKRTSISSDVPDADYALADDGPPGGDALGSSLSQDKRHNDKLPRPASPMHLAVGGGTGQHLSNSSPKSDYRGSPQRLTPISGRRPDGRSASNRAHQEIEAIRRDLDHLHGRVDKFSDSRQSAMYEELETLLLELLVRLEHVQSDAGAAEATDALVHTIRDTQKVLYILDEKALKYKPPNKYQY